MSNERRVFVQGEALSPRGIFQLQQRLQLGEGVKSPSPKILPCWEKVRSTLFLPLLGQDALLLGVLCLEPSVPRIPIVGTFAAPQNHCVLTVFLWLLDCPHHLQDVLLLSLLHDHVKKEQRRCLATPAAASLRAKTRALFAKNEPKTREGE